MNRKVLACTLVGSLLLNCGCTYRKGEFRHAFPLQKKLYVENYSAGLIGNMTSQYLTDSVNFRVYLGTFDDEVAWIYLRCHSDSVIAKQRFTQQYLLDNPALVPKTSVYSLLALKASKEFD
jgi:hypothetical protein